MTNLSLTDIFRIRKKQEKEEGMTASMTKQVLTLINSIESGETQVPKTKDELIIMLKDVMPTKTLADDLDRVLTSTLRVANRNGEFGVYISVVKDYLGRHEYTARAESSTGFECAAHYAIVKLEKEGLIKRIGKRVKLTESGLEKLDKINKGFSLWS